MPTKPTRRLNVSLLNGEAEGLEQLRIAIERRTGERISLAEVVRMAVATQRKFENGEMVDKLPLFEAGGLSRF